MHSVLKYKNVFSSNLARNHKLIITNRQCHVLLRVTSDPRASEPDGRMGAVSVGAQKFDVLGVIEQWRGLSGSMSVLKEEVKEARE